MRVDRGGECLIERPQVFLPPEIPYRLFAGKAEV